jgi:hypothetical protein
MAENTYPSVQAVERAFQPGTANDTVVPAFGAFVGRADQGPTAPTRVRSWNEFVRHFGSNYTDLHYAVYDFFSNGGRVCYVVRISGANAVAANLKVYDPSITTPSGGDVPLFTATASSPGLWGNRLFLVADTRDATNKRFDVSLFRLPTGITFDPSRRNSEYLLDSWQDVTLDPNDSRYLYAVANSPSATGSTYVTFSGQSYTPEGTRLMPGATGGYAFSGGVAGTYSAPYDAAVAYGAAIGQLNAIPGPYVLNLPGMTTASIVRSAVQDAEDRGDVFVVADTPLGTTPAGAVTYAGTDLGLSTLATRTPSFVGVYYPWLQMPAIGSAVTGRTSLRSPGGAVVGLMMGTDEGIGVWKAPAGSRAAISGAVKTERDFTEAELATLNAAHINVIRPVNGYGLCVMGGRTLKKFGIDRYVNVRRSLIHITENLKNLTQFMVFEPNDERLWNQGAGVVGKFLGEFWQSGGLKGATPNEAYWVKCDAENNTPASVEQGYVNIEVGVALAAPAEFVTISIGQFEGRPNVSTTLNGVNI